MTGLACLCMQNAWTVDSSSGRRHQEACSRYRLRRWPTCSKAFRNIPSRDADESLIEVVQVRDPRHPLFGKSFRIIRRTVDRAGNVPASYEVEHRNGSTLLISVQATEQYETAANQFKLSIDALKDLVCLADGLGSDECRSQGSLDCTGSDIAASDSRGRRDRTGGGRP